MYYIKVIKNSIPESVWNARHQYVRKVFMFRHIYLNTHLFYIHIITIYALFSEKSQIKKQLFSNHD
jgi:hypothetical protein